MGVGTKEQALASADDFLRQIEDSDGAKKGKRWLNQAMTDRQREALARENKIVSQLDLSFSKYKAACWLNYLWNKKEIDGRVLDYYEGDENAA